MEEQHSDVEKKPDEPQPRSEEESTEGMDGYGSVEEEEKETIDDKEVLSNPG
jgi:hypothetical protein